MPVIGVRASVITYESIYIRMTPRYALDGNRRTEAIVDPRVIRLDFRTKLSK